MCRYFKTETDVAQNLNDDFFLTLTASGPFHRKDFKWEKYGGTGLISEKMEALYAELNERAEAATSSYSITGDFLQYIYSVFVAMNHLKIWLRCSVHEFSFTDIFNDINHVYRAALLMKNVCGCFRFLWLWLLIAIMKRCTEQSTLQLYQTSSTETTRHGVPRKRSTQKLEETFPTINISIVQLFKVEYSISNLDLRVLNSKYFP